ncbi:MAG: hypothetical protein ACRDZX_06805 [Acidimicrobiales bacterium]
MRRWLFIIACAFAVLAAAWARPRPAYAQRSPARDNAVASPEGVMSACDGAAASVRSCDGAALNAIDAARAGEALGPLALPPGYARMDLAGQLVALTNAERVARSLPPWEGPDGALGGLARRGADAGADPGGPAGSQWVSNLAAGVLTALQADYEWMYDDGPGGPNTACSAPGSSACWAHRANLLRPWAGRIGAAGRRADDGRFAVAELMVETA